MCSSPGRRGRAEMALKIPFLISLVNITRPEDVVELARNQAADRQFRGRGPMFNRWLTGRMARVLNVDGVRLPSVAPQGDVQREARQTALSKRLDGQTPDPALVRDLAAFLLGQRAREDMEKRLQGAVAQLFAPGFMADGQSWKDAETLDKAPREFNPLKLLKTGLTGDVAAARGRLADGLNRDPVALHAAGLAVHSLVRSCVALRELARTPGQLAELSAEQAVRRAVRPPETVLRQAEADLEIGGERMRAGTLCVVKLREAYDETIKIDANRADDLAFMEAGWSFCPAATWVRGLMSAAWSEAAEQGGEQAFRVSPASDTPQFRAHGQATQDKAARRFRNLLGLRLGLDMVLACIALVAAGWLSGVIGLAERMPIRLWGLMMLWLVLMQVPSLISATRWRWPIYAGILGRVCLGAAYLLTTSVALRWFGMFELASVVALIAVYYRLFVAALQNHP